MSEQHVELELAGLASALASLEASGARNFDAISCDCARQLIERAAGRPPRTAALLAARAERHVQRLQERFERASQELRQRIEAAERTYGELAAERAALARGDVVAARRALRRRDHGPTPRPSPLARRQRCSDEYQAALAEMVAAVALARAGDVVPEQAGPYNPLRIARDLLEGIRAVSPIYLHAQLARLEELSSLLMLPELPDTKPKPQPVKASRPSSRPSKPARKRS